MVVACFLPDRTIISSDRGSTSTPHRKAHAEFCSVLPLYTISQCGHILISDFIPLLCWGHPLLSSLWHTACLGGILSWMVAHQLQVNSRKTEQLYIPGDASPSQDLMISLDNIQIMQPQGSSGHSSCLTWLNWLGHASFSFTTSGGSSLLSTKVTLLLVQSLVISRLDDWTIAPHLCIIRPLHLIHDAAAWLAPPSVFSHTTILLLSLHWLPVAAYIKVKTLMLAYTSKTDHHEP